MFTQTNPRTQSFYELNRFNFVAAQDTILSEAIKKSASVAVKKWQEADKFSGLTRLVSLDCSINSQGQLQIISFDPMPKGYELLRLRQQNLEPSSGSQTIVSPADHRKGFFDALYDRGMMFPEHPGAILDELEEYATEAANTHNFAVPPHNTYGENWLWERISYGRHEETLVPDDGFCLKAINRRQVFICPPLGTRSRLKKQGIRGIMTESQMIRQLEENRTMYYQPFIQPMVSDAGHPMIYSLYFQYYNLNKCYAYVGGLSIASKSLRIGLDGDGVTLGVIDSK